jgi:hypothetical protein
MSSNHSLILSKSPLDILGLFLTVIRARFTSVPEDFPWEWNESDSQTSVYIEVGAGDEVGLKDVRPAIYVDRGPVVFPKVVIGDFAGGQLHTGKKAYYTAATGQINIDCVSKNRGESAILGELVQSFVLMSSDLILRTYNLRDVTPVTLGGTEVWEKDDRLFNTRVTSQISYDVKWGISPDSGKIAEIVANLLSQDGNILSTVASTSLNRVKK